MALQRYVLNANVAGVGRRGEVVEADPVLWAVYVEAGFLAPVDEDGERVRLEKSVPDEVEWPDAGASAREDNRAYHDGAYDDVDGSE